MSIKKYLKFDYFLAGSVLALLLFGILILGSVSAITSYEKFDNTTYYLFHQINHGILFGLAIGLICFFIPINFFRKYAWMFMLINLVFMVMVFIPGLGIVSGGASRWLNFRFFTFQPSELLKLTFMVYLAAWLSNPIRTVNKKDKRKDASTKRGNLKYTLVPFLIIIGVIAFLLNKQSDLSTLAVIAASGLIMYFCSNTPFWHTLLIFFTVAGGAAIMIKTSSYRLTRLKVMIDIIKRGVIADPMGTGYQVKQILIGIGSGGIFGLGLGASAQKAGFIPQTMSDSIFAILAEETGFLGAILLIFLILFFLLRSFLLAKRTEDYFSKMFAIGFSSWICIQSFVNIGAMVGILPLTGIPLPFFSYGGSHLVVELIGVGILLNISRSS